MRLLIGFLLIRITDYYRHRGPYFLDFFIALSLHSFHHSYPFSFLESQTIMNSCLHAIRFSLVLVVKHIILVS